MKKTRFVMHKKMPVSLVWMLKGVAYLVFGFLTLMLVLVVLSFFSKDANALTVPSVPFTQDCSEGEILLIPTDYGTTTQTVVCNEKEYLVTLVVTEYMRSITSQVKDEVPKMNIQRTVTVSTSVLASCEQAFAIISGQYEGSISAFLVANNFSTFEEYMAKQHCVWQQYGGNSVILVTA